MTVAHEFMVFLSLDAWFEASETEGMEIATYSPAPLWAAIRKEIRETREARAARKTLERELASYTSSRDLNDLDAILDRHSDQETAAIRRILAAQRRG
jgi:hypothetical protein